MLSEHVIQSNFAQSAINNASPALLRRSGVLVLCALALLSGCANQSGTRAPVTDLNNASSGVARTYVIKPGDTLNKIARANGVDEASIVRLNKLVNPDRLIIGQTLKLSEGSEAIGSSSRPAPSAKAEASPVDVSMSGSQNGESTKPAADAGLISWGWPANGKVIQGFTQSTKGIDIAGNAGDAIEAAANGKVMYSGNGVRGLGNLIIVNHDNGFITAYAHNRTLLVKTGQDVKKGTKIAEMGQSDAASVRLHFEVRRQGTPVNPLQYLPSR